jgi:hypothetical protein
VHSEIGSSHITGIRSTLDQLKGVEAPRSEGHFREYLAVQTSRSYVTAMTGILAQRCQRSITLLPHSMFQFFATSSVRQIQYIFNSPSETPTSDNAVRQFRIRAIQDLRSAH